MNEVSPESPLEDRKPSQANSGKRGPTRSIPLSPKNLPRLIGVLLVRGYQLGFKWMPPTCRYHPSCSQYTLEAIEKYGLLRGSWMGAKRIARCGPWHPGGHDPVP